MLLLRNKKPSNNTLPSRVRKFLVRIEIYLYDFETIANRTKSLATFEADISLETPSRAIHTEWQPFWNRFRRPLPPFQPSPASLQFSPSSTETKVIPQTSKLISSWKRARVIFVDNVERRRSSRQTGKRGKTSV